jgi:hypothetical protein
MHKIILFIVIYAISLASYGQQNLRRSKEVGNGQLVVIPKGHTSPVPYEVAVVWETGKFRNFFKLPCMPGVLEPREEFNKEYACNAMPWINLVKDVSPGLYKKIIGAAGKTKFNIINNLILWEHKPYPEGEIDYKKYEKAAFYNGEIILSIPVMDRVGPLYNVLTKEQNQGFIVLHELINASFPNHEVAWKLELGEILINKIIFNHSKFDVMVSLGLKDINFILGENDLELLKKVLREILDIKNEDKEIVAKYLFAIENIQQNGLNFKDAYLEYISKNKTQKISKFRETHNKFMEAAYLTAETKESLEIFDVKFIKDLSSLLKIPLIKFYNAGLIGIQPEIPAEVINEINVETFLNSIEKHVNNMAKLDSVSLASQVFELILILKSEEMRAHHEISPGRFFTIRKIKEIITANIQLSDIIHQYDIKNKWDFDKSGLVENSLPELTVNLLSKISLLLEKKGFDSDKSYVFLEWLAKHYVFSNALEIIYEPPFEKNTKIFLKNKIYEVRSIKRKQNGEYFLNLSGEENIQIKNLREITNALIIN